MTHLYGHAAAVDAFLSARASGRLHHAWLLAGPQGVGKARFADMAARRLLAEAAGPPVLAPGLELPGDHPIAHLFEAGSHPDFARLERLVRDRSDQLARNISVDQVRGLQRLLSTTPSLSEWRAIVVDSIDDMERSAANALLKNLEEPPANTVFLLVSHAPGRLLPTIRSRCRLLRFGRLDDADMTAALRDAMPEADAAEIASLAALGAGAPGSALRFAGLDIEALDQAMAALVTEGDPLNQRRAALARQLALKAAQPRYEMFLERAPSAIAEEARRRSGAALAEAIALWEKARALAGSAVRLSLDPQTTVFELGSMLAALAPQTQASR
ncbi:DNA polymerase III subunit delta' [Sphingomonas quercus]|uniref:DNA polymerase III subunit delta n=1 Tax=Sphingomonas quercus TaxID=2842451 RepID=A0ABS6BG36_9SPHN|nr:DNA polymerase III subunit delta' [Sphingomonas quercus]MBU3076254.1 DNA polymerase III subunit delta' [Sphingomonas quercus]